MCPDFGPWAWNLAVEEHRLRVCEYNMPRKVLRPHREEVVGGWTELHSHNDELIIYTL